MGERAPASVVEPRAVSLFVPQAEATKLNSQFAPLLTIATAAVYRQILKSDILDNNQVASGGFERYADIIETLEDIHKPASLAREAME